MRWSACASGWRTSPGFVEDFRRHFRQAHRGLSGRAEEIIERELAVAPELVRSFEALMQAPAATSWLGLLRSTVESGRFAKCHSTVRLLDDGPWRGSNNGHGGRCSV